MGKPAFLSLWNLTLACNYTGQNYNADDPRHQAKCKLCMIHNCELTISPEQGTLCTQKAGPTPIIPAELSPPVFQHWGSNFLNAKVPPGAKGLSQASLSAHSAADRHALPTCPMEGMRASYSQRGLQRRVAKSCQRPPICTHSLT